MAIQHVAPDGPVIPDEDELDETDLPDEEEEDEDEERKDVEFWDDDWPTL